MKIRLLLMIALVMLMAAVIPVKLIASGPVEGNISFSFTIQPLNINGEGAQFAPAFYQNGIVFCSSKRDNLRFGTAAVGNDLSLYYAAQNADKTFKAPQKMKGKGMAGYEAGPACISPDFKHILFTRNKNKAVKDEAATWGLYFAEMTGQTEWGEADHFVHNYNQFDVQQASLSPNGRILYFVSDVQGGVGGTDIYMCYKIGNTWSRPENLGSRVNSIYNESFPYITDDGTLYYSSAGFDNGDGVDIFYTRKIAGEWMNPEKLPAPVNSAKDDFSFIISLNQSGSGYGYFASDRNGNTDLFSFSVSVSQQQPAFANIQPGNTDVAVARSINNEGGQVFSSSQPIGKKVMLNGIIGMNKLFFPQGKWHIIPETARELDKLVAYMTQNPRLSVEISTHTDARGDDDANLQLSTKRANAIQAYLMSKYIAGSRITALGYGETQLLNYCRNGMNCSDDMHEQNNRVEVRATPESEFTVNWGGANYAAAPTQQASFDQPVSRSIDAQSAANGKLFYKLTVGPFDRIDNRTFYECRQLDMNLTYEDSPKGKVVVLGPYENMQEAYRNKAYLEARGIQRTQVNSMSSSSMVRYEPPKEADVPEDSHNNATYELHVGPFKHVDNNTYHRFANLGTPIHIEYSPKGMMIVLGPYKTMSEVEEFKELVKARVSSNKTKVQVFNDGEQVLDGKKVKHKQRK